MQSIKSKDNPLIKKLTLLMNNRKERHSSSLFVIEGLRICFDALTSNVRIKDVLFSESFIEHHPDCVDKFLVSCDSAYLISDSISKKLSDTVNSQGIFCLCEMNTIDFSFDGNKYIILDNLQDPGNIGTIIRTAEAFNISGIITLGNCVDIYSQKVLRSTMGSVFRIPFTSFNSISELLPILKNNNIKLYGTILDKSAKSLSNTIFHSKSAVIIGNEANGISDDVKNVCDNFIYIEMTGKAESLNASVAASIIMWELQKN